MDKHKPIQWYEIADKETQAVRCLHCDAQWIGGGVSHHGDGCPVNSSEILFHNNMALVDNWEREERRSSWWSKVAPAFFATGFLAGVTASQWSPQWHLGFALGGTLISAGFVLLLWRTIPD